MLTLPTLLPLTGLLLMLLAGLPLPLLTKLLLLFCETWRGLPLRHGLPLGLLLTLRFGLTL